MKLNAKQLRNADPTPEQVKNLRRNPIYIIIDNVLDTYNIGSIFRLADAVSATRVYICGASETPPNSRIKKASIETWKWIDWQYKETAHDAIKELREEVPDVSVIAIEQDDRSVSFDQVEYSLPVALIVGHESDGVSDDALDASDQIVELPMYGVNTSLNVMVSCGIILYHVVSRRTKELQKST